MMHARRHPAEEVTAPTSETRRLFANFAWENSPLGPVTAWPPEMQAVVRTVLGSAFPICTFWGDESVLIYNDVFVGLFSALPWQSFGIPLRDGWDDIRDMLAPAIDRVRSTGEALNYHRNMLPLARVRQPEECYFDLSYSAVRNLDDGIIGVMLVAVDKTRVVVTERRKSVTELLPPVADSYARIYSQLRNMLALNNMDARCAALFAVDEKSGRLDEEIWSLRMEERAQRAWTAFLDSALPIERDDPFFYPEALTLPDWARPGCIIPVRDGEGAVMAVLVVMPDPLVPIERSHAAFAKVLADRLGAMIRSSEARRRELGSVKQRLEHRDELYRFLFENIGDAVFYSTIDKRRLFPEFIIAANPQASALTGYEPKKLVGLPWESLFSTDDQDGRQGEGFSGELTIRTKSSGSLRGEFTTKLVSGPDGVVRAITVVHDLSSRLVREQRREERARLQTMAKLTGGVAHDFNNFLTVVLGSLDVLGATLPESSVQWQAVENARLASERAASLTNQLLSYSSRQPLQAKATDIHELIAEVELLIKSSLGETNRLAFEFGESLPPCALDHAQMTSAMLNLATNARDAMPGGGTLTIRTRVAQSDESVSYDNDHVLAPGTYVSVKFEDTGEGIPDELRSRIFEPFFTTKQTGSGTGLGLSMVRGFIRQLGGEARALRAPSGGACIELLIPSSDHPASTDRSRTSPKAEGYRGTPAEIVIGNPAAS